MQIDRTELIRILEKIRPGIAKNETMESMTYFYLSGDDIISYNDKISIQYDFKTDFSLFVKASDFYKLLTKIKDKDVTLVADGDCLKVSTASTRITLPTISDNELTERIKSVKESLATGKWKKLPEDFSDKINLCSYTASKMEQEGTLTCVNVKGDVCTSSDNNRISQATIKGPVDEMLIKASVIKDLIGIDPKGYKITKAWIHFRDKNKCIFSVRRVTGEFPDFSQFMDFSGTDIELPSEILDGIDLVSILTDPDDPSVNIKISKGVILLKGKVQNGNIMHRCKIDSKDTELDLTINPAFLKDMVKYNSKITVGQDKARIRTDNNFCMITALYG